MAAMESWSLICIMWSMTEGMNEGTICGRPMPSILEGFGEVSVLSFVL